MNIDAILDNVVKTQKPAIVLAITYRKPVRPGTPQQADGCLKSNFDGCTFDDVAFMLAGVMSNFRSMVQQLAAKAGIPERDVHDRIIHMMESGWND